MHQFFVYVAQHKEGFTLYFLGESPLKFLQYRIKVFYLFTGVHVGGHCSWHPALHDWSVGSPGKLSAHRTHLCSQ